MVSCRSNPLISQRRENMNHESWIMSASWVSYWRRCMTSLLILRLSPNKIMSFKSHDEWKAGSLNLPVCSVSSSAHMTDLHLSCQSVATLHALPQILNRLPQSPQAREKKSFSKKSCPCLMLAQGCGPTSGCPGGIKPPRVPGWVRVGVQSLFGPKCSVRQLKGVFHNGTGWGIQSASSIRCGDYSR